MPRKPKRRIPLRDFEDFRCWEWNGKEWVDITHIYYRKLNFLERFVNWLKTYFV